MPTTSPQAQPARVVDAVKIPKSEDTDNPFRTTIDGGPILGMTFKK
jgi:hypothetical protein